MNKINLAVIGAGCLAAVFRAAFGEAAPPVRLGGPDVVKLDWNTRSLRAADLNGDGLTDLAVINNDTAKIEMLYQRRPGEPLPAPPRRVNPSRWEPELENSRFTKIGLVTGMYAFALETGDLNGDGKTDLVYTGKNDPLTVRYQGDGGTWTESWIYGQLKPAERISTLAVRDLNGDGLNDLAVLAEDQLYLFYQFEDGRMAEPKTCRLAAENASGLRVADLNADGREDLYYFAGGTKRIMLFRLGAGSLGFGPEISLILDPALAGLVSLGGNEFIGIEEKTHILETFRLEAGFKPADSLEDLQPRAWATGGSSRSPTLYATGDFNGDGRIDVAAGNPNTAEVLLFLQNEQGAFNEGVAFPTLAHLTGLAAGDFSGRGRASLVALSEKEEIMGVSSYAENGRLGFPEVLPAEGAPLTAAAGDLDGGGRDEIVFVEEEDREYRLGIFHLDEQTEQWQLRTQPLEGAERDPSALAIKDLNGDSRPDLIIMIPREPALLLTQTGDGGFVLAAETSSIRKGMLTDLDPSRLGWGDADGDGRAEMIVTGRGFARSLRLDAGGRLDIVDQYNASRGDDWIRGPLFYDLDRDGVEDLLFYDDESRIQMLQKDASGVFRFKKAAEIGPIDLTAAEIFHPGGERPPQMIYWGKDRFWVFPLIREGWKIHPLSSYETDLKNVRYNHLEKADLNSDGEMEIIALDGLKHVIEVLQPCGDSWKSVLHFTVFDANVNYKGRGGAPMEPREIVTADLTGDGREDCALLVHDRVLVYYQE